MNEYKTDYINKSCPKHLNRPIRIMAPHDPYKSFITLKEEKAGEDLLSPPAYHFLLLYCWP